MFFIGFAEFDDDVAGLHVSPINPRDDYEASIAAKQTIGPECIDDFVASLSVAGGAR